MDFSAGFKLFADSTEFERGMAKALSSQKSVMAEMRREQVALFTAAGKLEDAQARRALESNAGYNRTKILQVEILALKKSIDAIDGNTIQKIELQTRLSEKQLVLEREIASMRVAGNAAMSSGASNAAKGAADAAKSTGAWAGALGKLVSFSGALKALGGSLLGIGATMAAPAIADGIARLFTGFSKEDERRLDEMVSKTEKAAEAQEKALEKLRAAKAKQHQESLDNAERERQLSLKAAEEGREAVRKTQEANEEAAIQNAFDQWDKLGAKEKANRDRATTLRQLEADLNRPDESELEELKRRSLTLENEINVAQSLARRGGEQTDESKEGILKKLIEQKKLTEQIAKLEGDIAKKNDDTLKLKVSITRVGRTDEALSDRELAAKEKNLRQQALQASLNIGGVYTGASTNDILGGIRNQELWRVNDEQNRRSRVRGLARAFGEDRAFEMSGLSEQHFRDIISGATESQQLARRTALGIEQLNNLLKSGIPVVNLNK